MRTILPAYSIITEGRVRRSCGSLDRQTAQSQPSVGTPMDVPLPNTVSVAFMLRPSYGDLPALGRIQDPHRPPVPVAVPGCGGRDSALVNSTYAMRTS